MIRDKNVEWLEKRVFIPVYAGPLAETTTPTVLRTWQSATSVTAQIAASTATIVRTSAQNDGATVLWLAPYDLDRKKAMRFRVHYSQTATSGTATWQILWDQIIATQAGTAGATVIAAPATALDTVIPAASGTVVANDYRVTDFGVLKKNTILDTTDALILAVTTTDATPNAGLGIIGVELRYTPRRTGGPERNIRPGRRLSTALGVTLNATQENAAGS